MFKSLAISLFMLFSFKAVGQESSADSLQRILMRDSLNVSDAIITQVFAVRDSFNTASAALAFNASLTEAQKESSLSALITQTNNSIKTALGNAAYQHYKEMITRRMKARPRLSGMAPLAAAGN